ncbi:MAG: ABC transporter permease [Bacteroidota bacterium]
MRTRDMLALAARQARARFLESFLIVLGVALGSAVVASFAGLIGSVNDLVNTFLETPLAREILLMPKDQDYSVFWSGSSIPVAVPVGPAGGPTARLALQDLDRIRKGISSAAYVYVHHPMGLSLSPAQPPGEGAQSAASRGLEKGTGGPASAGTAVPLGKSGIVPVVATTPELFAAYGLRAKEGSLFADSDVRSGARVIVIGSKLAKRLFGKRSGVGEQLACSLGATPSAGAAGEPGGGWKFTVVGVLEAQTSPENDRAGQANAPGGLMGQFDDNAFIPVTSLTGGLAAELEVREIGVMPASLDRVPLALEELRRLSETVYGGQLAFRSELDAMRRAMREMRSFATAILLLASAGLIIAAINILNLMLARVLRRVKAIGTSAALGASRRAMFAQFMAESLLLGLTGSAFGLLVALGFTRLMSLVIGGLRVAVGSWGLVAGVGASCLTSIAFGLYPAYLAARVIPVDALREE